jgi:hypothetical protein
MATVAVAGKISVVFVKADLVAWWQFLISAACALCEDAFAGFILGGNLLESCALWRRIFRCARDRCRTARRLKARDRFLFPRS